MAILTVSSKGQLVIPAPIRKILGIHAKTKVRLTLSEDNTRAILEPLPSDPVEALTGIFKGYGASLANELADERKKDRAREEA